MNIEEKFIDVKVRNGQSNYTPARDGETIDYIVFHTFDGLGDDLYNWFQNASPGTSAHYSVQFDGSVKQYVRTSDTAHHVGHSWGNRKSIGIEHQDNKKPDDSKRTNQLYEASAQLVAKLVRENPTIPLNRSFCITHREAFEKFNGYAPTFTCSAGLDVDRIVNRAKEILNTPIEDPVKKENQELKTEVANLKSTIQQKEDTITTLSDQISTLREENDTLKITIKNLKDQLEKPKTNDFNLFLFIYEQIKKSVGKSK